MYKERSLNTNKISKNKLFIAKDPNIERHPSVKNLLNQINNPEPISINNYKINNNNNISIPTDNENSQKSNINIGINIIPCEHKIKDEKETFFIEADVNNKILNNSVNKLNIPKPSFYMLNEEQRKLDKKITNLIEEGKDYIMIERQFESVLKK